MQHGTWFLWQTKNNKKKFLTKVTKKDNKKFKPFLDTQKKFKNRVLKYCVTKKVYNSSGKKIKKNSKKGFSYYTYGYNLTWTDLAFSWAIEGNFSYVSLVHSSVYGLVYCSFYGLVQQYQDKCTWLCFYSIDITKVKI